MNRTYGDISKVQKLRARGTELSMRVRAFDAGAANGHTPCPAARDTIDADRAELALIRETLDSAVHAVPMTLDQKIACELFYVHFQPLEAIRYFLGITKSRAQYLTTTMDGIAGKMDAAMNVPASLVHLVTRG